MNPLSPTDSQLDALRELANVGCGQAANALSRLVGGRRVLIEVPRAQVTALADFSALAFGEDVHVVAVSVQMLGDLPGSLILVLPESDAQRLCAVLLNRPPEDALRAADQSALSEAANIVASACLNAIGELTGLQAVPSVPKLSLDAMDTPADQVLLHLNGDDSVLMLEARFATTTQPAIEGRLLLMPNHSSVSRLLQALGV